MPETPVFQRLIRFIDDEDKEQYGDVPLEVQISKIRSTSVTVITGDIKSGFSRTSNTAVVKKVILSLHMLPLPLLTILVIVPGTASTYNPMYWSELSTACGGSPSQFSWLLT